MDWALLDVLELFDFDFFPPTIQDFELESDKYFRPGRDLLGFSYSAEGEGI